MDGRSENCAELRRIAQNCVRIAHQLVSTMFFFQSVPLSDLWRKAEE